MLDAPRMSPLRVPHESEPCERLWTAWPDHPDWEGVVDEARAEIAAFVSTAAHAPGGPDIVVLEPPDGARASDEVRAAAEVKPAVYGDIWLRDTGPVWALDGRERVAVRFRFNGWGGKYLYPGDVEVASELARALEAPVRDVDLVAEGGAFEADGEGAIITTRACLLERTRNPGVSASDVEAVLADALGAERVIWLETGLTRDHTDGHVDTLARFVRPGLVVCQSSPGPQDPNAAVLDEIARTLDRARDAQGRRIDVARVPSPGYVADAEGRSADARFAHELRARRAALDRARIRNALIGSRACGPRRAVSRQGGGGVVRAGSRARGRRLSLRLQRRPGRGGGGVSTLSLAVLQAAFGDDEAANIATVERLVRAAAADGARIILAPELFEGPYFPKSQDERWFARARAAAGHPVVARMADLASELGVVLPVSIFERDGPSYYNALVMIDADGAVLGVYRKSHIPDGPGYQEKFYFRPGDTGFRVWDTAHGRIGVAICWDQWFPEAARALTLMGAEALLYPTAIGDEPQAPGLDTSDRWRRVMQGHAAANVVPVAAANRIGVEDGQAFYGRSFITDETGAITAEVGRGEEGFAVARFDRAALERARAAWGFFRDRRPDLYGPLVR